MAHKKAKRKMTDKQALITILCIVGAAVLLIGALILIGALNKDAVTDPHAGHNHGDSSLGDGHYEGDGHDHSSSNTNTGANAKVKYQLYQNEDGTYRLVFRNSNNTLMFEKNNLERVPLKEAVDEAKGIYSLSWALYKDPAKNGPNDFENIYYNEKTGQVSQVFRAPRGCDGVRIAYGSNDQTKVIVQDIFNEKSYHKEYTLENAYTKAKDIIVGGRLQADKKTVMVAYVTDEKGSTLHAIVKLYE